MSVPKTHRTGNIALPEARRLIARAVDKAEQIGMRGAFAVVGGSGSLVSLSRMDHGGAGGSARARSKAWIAATQQIPSLEHLKRMGMIAPPMVTGFVACCPEAVFPGAGGMPITEDGWVVGGMAASGAVIGPFVDYPGADPQQLIADGQPSNGEDLIVHYAMGLPYEGQHGDDLERWVNAYGAFPDDAGPGLGMAPAPPAVRQLEHRWALATADTAMDAAVEAGKHIAVAIVDRRGDPIQIDAMDGCPGSAPVAAELAAAAAANFQCPSGQLAERYSEQALRELAAALPYGILSAPGGVPIEEDGEVVAAIGIGGPPPGECHELATGVVAGLR